MSIEQKVEKLTVAVEGLTEVIKDLVSNGPSAGTPAEDKPELEVKRETAAQKKKRLAAEKAAKEAEEAEEDDGLGDDEGDDEITLSQCKELAKEKMADGVNRADIKELISKLGYDTINKVEGDDLVKLHKQLSAMEAE